MIKVDCVIHGKKHTSPWGWTHKTWHTQNGIVKGWGCRNKPFQYEFVPETIKNERITHAADQLQSHRQGELSKEWVETYPDRAKGMLKEGIITKDQIKKAKPVWKEVKGWEKQKKVDSHQVAKSEPKSVLES